MEFVVAVAKHFSRHGGAIGVDCSTGSLRRKHPSVPEGADRESDQLHIPSADFALHSTGSPSFCLSSQPRREGVAYHRSVSPRTCGHYIGGHQEGITKGFCERCPGHGPENICSSFSFGEPGGIICRHIGCSLEITVAIRVGREHVAISIGICVGICECVRITKPEPITLTVSLTESVSKAKPIT